MSVIYVLIPLAIVIVLLAIALFFWAVRKNQFDDLDRQGYEILFDDEAADGNKKPADKTAEHQNQDNSHSADGGK